MKIGYTSQTDMSERSQGVRTMSDKLTPVRCGCGGEAHHDSASCWNPEEEEMMPNFWHRVICKNCGTQTKAFYTEAEAIQAWNKAMGAKDINVPNKFATDTNVGDKERTAKVENIEVEFGDDEYVHDRMGDMYCYGDCGNCGQTVSHNQKYCHECGVKLEWE